MKKKLNSVLLIDDDRSTNFFNKIIIQKTNCTDNIVVVESGEQGLEYLNTSIDQKFPQPDLIFLDINMPGMDGWEFMKHYEKLDDNKKGKIIIIMLTTSLNPDDKEKAEKIVDIKGFKNKPLSTAMVMEIVQHYFPDYL